MNIPDRPPRAHSSLAAPRLRRRRRGSRAARPPARSGTRSLRAPVARRLQGRGPHRRRASTRTAACAPGCTLGSTPLPDATSSVWSSAVLAGRHRCCSAPATRARSSASAAAGSTLAATTGQMAVSSIASAWNGDVYRGHLPEGKLYRPAARRGQGRRRRAARRRCPSTEDVWASRSTRRRRRSTRPRARRKLFRIDAAGKAQVYFDSDEPHL